MESWRASMLLGLQTQETLAGTWTLKAEDYSLNSKLLFKGGKTRRKYEIFHKNKIHILELISIKVMTKTTDLIPLAVNDKDKKIDMHGLKGNLENK
jgi:hypothetical protein